MSVSAYIPGAYGWEFLYWRLLERDLIETWLLRSDMAENVCTDNLLPSFDDKKRFGRLA